MEDLIELVKSIKVRCEVIQLLYRTPDYLMCIPTVMEDLYEDAQTAVTEFCIDKKHD